MVCGRSILDHFADYVTLASDRADDGSLPDRAASLLLLVPMAVRVLTAYVGFVNLDFANELAEILRSFIAARNRWHMNQASPIVAAFIWDHAMNLKRADALLRLQHHVRDFEPCFEQRIFVSMKDRSDQRRRSDSLSARTCWHCQRQGRLFQLCRPSRLPQRGQRTPSGQREQTIRLAIVLCRELRSKSASVMLGLDRGVRFGCAAHAESI